MVSGPGPRHWSSDHSSTSQTQSKRRDGRTGSSRKSKVQVIDVSDRNKRCTVSRCHKCQIKNRRVPDTGPPTIPQRHKHNQNVATNRSEKVQRAVLFRGGRRSLSFDDVEEWSKDHHSSASSPQRGMPEGRSERDRLDPAPARVLHAGAAGQSLQHRVRSSCAGVPIETLPRADCRVGGRHCTARGREGPRVHAQQRTRQTPHQFKYPLPSCSSVTPELGAAILKSMSSSSANGCGLTMSV